MTGPEVEFGYAAGQQFEVCAHLVDSERMLCGRKIGRILVSIEEAPANLHPKCRERLDADSLGRQPRCPVCDLPVDVAGGLVLPHGSCVGVNLPPKQGQS